MPNIENLIYWKNNPETQQVLKIIQEEINQKKEIMENGGLLKSEDVAKEYTKCVSYIHGLKFIEKLLKEEEYNENDFA